MSWRTLRPSESDVRRWLASLDCDPGAATYSRLVQRMRRAVHTYTWPAALPAVPVLILTGWAPTSSDKAFLALYLILLISVVWFIFGYRRTYDRTHPTGALIYYCTVAMRELAQWRDSPARALQYLAIALPSFERVIIGNDLTARHAGSFVSRQELRLRQRWIASEVGRLELKLRTAAQVESDSAADALRDRLGTVLIAAHLGCWYVFPSTTDSDDAIGAGADPAKNSIAKVFVEALAGRAAEMLFLVVAAVGPVAAKLLPA